MKRWVWVSFTAMAALLLLSMIACDSDSNDTGGAADTTGGSGYSLSTFAGKWKVFYVNGGYAGHTITLAADGAIIAQAEEECGGGGTSGGSFYISSSGYLVSKDAWLRCPSFPAGDKILSVYQLQIKSSGNLKGSRADTYRAADGTTLPGGTDAIYLAR